MKEKQKDKQRETKGKNERENRHERKTAEDGTESPRSPAFFLTTKDTDTKTLLLMNINQTYS